MACATCVVCMGMDDLPIKAHLLEKLIKPMCIGFE
jgi:hypothetical protein